MIAPTATTLVILVLAVAGRAAGPPGSEAPTISVSTIEDTSDGVCDSHCSLREALAAAPPDSTITFASALGGTIALKDTLTIRKHVTINGPTAKAITISGDNKRRVLYVDAGVHLTIRNLTIANGRVRGESGLEMADGGVGSAAKGAGLYNNGGVATIESCTLSNNSVRGGTGRSVHPATYASGGIGGDALGGGIYNAGTLILINSTLTGNSAKGGTGGDGGSREVVDLTKVLGPGVIRILGRVPESNARGGDGGNGFGGAIYSISDAWIVGCTLAGNSASAGSGGLGASGSSGAGAPNGAPGEAAGAALYRPGALPSGKILEKNLHRALVVKNTLIAGGSSGPDCDADIDSGGYNIDSDGSCRLTGEGDRTISNLKIESLKDNGGPTRTHALPENSPARDGGDPKGCTDHNGNPLATDQRGRSRAPGGRCDIGAFESSR